MPDGANATISNTGPSIAISYQAGVGSEPPPNKQAGKKGGYEEFGFKNQGQCIKAVNHVKLIWGDRVRLLRRAGV